VVTVKEFLFYIKFGGYKVPITYVVIIRSIISFFTLIFFIRLIGKQQVAQLTFFDYVNDIEEDFIFTKVVFAL